MAMPAHAVSPPWKLPMTPLMAAQAVAVAPLSMAKAETSITKRWLMTMGARTCRSGGRKGKERDKTVRKEGIAPLMDLPRIAK